MNRTICLTSIVLCLIFIHLVSAQGSDYTTNKISLSGAAINELITQDINRDGTKELIIQQGKELLVYQSTTDIAKSDLEPISRFILPDEIFLWDIGQLTDNGPVELIGLTPQGVKFFPYTDKGFINHQIPVNIPLTSTIFSGQLNSAPLYQKLLFNLNNDNLTDLIIPGSNKFILVYQKEPGKFEMVQEITVKPTHQIGIGDTLFDVNKAEVSLPLIYQACINEDKIPELLILQNGAATIYQLTDNGQYIKLNYPLTDKTEHTEELILGLGDRGSRRDQDFDYNLPPLLGDINNDGLTDLVLADTDDSLIAVYLNRKLQLAPFAPQKPDHIKRINGWLIDYQLTDINHDNFLDLIVIQMKKVNILSGLQILLAHQVDWSMDVYLARPAYKSEDTNRIYAESPDYTMNLSVPFTFAVNPNFLKFQTPLILSLDGDFNRDGLKDLLIRCQPEQPLKIFYGTSRQVFNSTPGISIKLNAGTDCMPDSLPYGKPVITDLNNDGHDDIIVCQKKKGDNPIAQYLIELFIWK
jgi:hypothetical protein